MRLAEKICTRLTVDVLNKIQVKNGVDTMGSSILIGILLIVFWYGLKCIVKHIRK